MTLASSFGLFGSLVWLTPIWLLGIGSAIGLLFLLAIYVCLFLANRARAADSWLIVREGPLFPVLILAVVFAGVAAITTLVVPYDELLASTARLPFVRGEQQVTVEVPPETIGQEVEIPLRRDELRSLEISSTGDVLVEPRQIDGNLDKEFGLRDVPGGIPSQWEWSLSAESVLAEDITGFEVSNLSQVPIEATFAISSNVQFPEVWLIAKTALAVLALFALYFVVRLSFPKVTAIAMTTAKEGASQPLFYVVMALGGFLLLTFIYVPYNTFGEDVKMLKDSGLTMIMIFGIVVALWTASVSIADELEGRTALTLLSKPIHRRQFIFGKFFGVIGPVFLLFIFLGALFLATVSYKVVYDAREAAKLDPTWRDCYVEMVSTVPGLVLAFMETVVLAAISVAISTRLPMIPNLVICASIYALGHIVPRLVASSVDLFPIISFMAKFLATVLPVLEHFNIQAAIASGADVPLSYLGWAGVYCLLYTAVAMLIALVLFEDRDLA